MEAVQEAGVAGPSCEQELARERRREPPQRKAPAFCKGTSRKGTGRPGQSCGLHGPAGRGDAAPRGGLRWAPESGRHLSRSVLRRGN